MLYEKTNMPSMAVIWRLKGGYKKEAVSRGYKQKRKGGFIVGSKKR